MPAVDTAFEINAVIRAVMDDLGLPIESIQLGLSKGYQPWVIDPTKPFLPGNVIWAPGRQLQALWDHFNRLFAQEQAETAQAYRRGLQDGKAAGAPSPTMGQLAYERRMAGEKWSDIGPCAFGNARAYAKSRQLPFPPIPNTH